MNVSHSTDIDVAHIEIGIFWQIVEVVINCSFVCFRDRWQMEITQNLLLFSTFLLQELLVEKNLLRAHIVVNRLLRKPTWNNIRKLTTHTSPVRYVHSPVHPKNVSTITYKHTQSTNHFLVMRAGSLSLKAVHWNDTNWLIQGRNLTSVHIVGSRSVRRVFWPHTFVFTQAKNRMVVIRAERSLHGRVIGIFIPFDVQVPQQQNKR